MSFLDYFSAELRDRLLQAGTHEKVLEGELLIRRGERVGDMFLIEHGSFEVVDRRSNPEIVIAIVTPGAVLGEMTFVDESERGADVRAAEDSVVVRWSSDQVRARFEEDPALAAAFYRAVSVTMSKRFRNYRHIVNAGGLSSGPGGPTNSSDAAQARALASQVLSHWVAADDELRRDPSDCRARELVRIGMAVLVDDVSRWLSSLNDDHRRQQGGALLGRELRPYLSRAVTGERALDPLGQVAGDPRLLAHIIRGEPEGSSEFGTRLDAHLLELPTMQAIRSRSKTLAAAARRRIPQTGRCDLMVVNPNCGASIAGVLLSMSERGGRVRVIDSSREVLGIVDAGLPRRPSNVSFSFVQADIAEVMTGRLDIWNDLHHIVMLDSIMDYLPDRLVVSLAEWAASHLGPGGCLLATGLAPSADALLIDHVLGWPLVRRSATSLAQLMTSCAGLTAEVVGATEEAPPAASVVICVVRQGDA